VPGFGKSTLLLEVASKISSSRKTLYVSAEESPVQVLLRAKRLEINFDNLYILGEDNLEVVGEYIEEHGFKFVIIDSIQVVYFPQCEGTKGSVSQIRGCASYLVRLAKEKGITIFVVGHVTKEGAIAGPKLLEHIVDCVLYFEGDILSSYRILRATKNRFGPTQDFAVFEMTSCGLKEVKKTQEIFLPHKDKLVYGSCIVSVIEGSRPLLLEIQALVSKASFGVVRRRSIGFDFNRFSLLVAIIEKRLKISLSNEDVFLNVAGGLKINDPSADLGALLCIVSSYKEKEVLPKCAFIGEVGLSGELRRVSSINLRLREIERADFESCIIPEANSKEVDKEINLKIEGFSSIKEVVERIWR
jgi:DNA repair protein RadA/Sms